MSEPTRWWARLGNADRLVYGLYAVCGVLLLIELVYHRHAYFAVERWFGFYAVLGFLAYVGIVFSAKGLRRLLRRPEDYYHPPAGAAPAGPPPPEPEPEQHDG